MASLRDIKNRIDSVKSIQQITRAMKMVAVAKLKKAQERLLQSRPYTDEIRNILGSLIERTHPDNHPLLAKRDSNETCIVVVTADRGLCGSFNSNIIRTAAKYIQDSKNETQISLMCVGKKNHQYFKNTKNTIIESYTDFFNGLSFRHAVNISRNIIKLYEEHKFKKLILVYNEFKSVIQQNIIVRELLPFQADDFSNTEDKNDKNNNENNETLIDYIYEPNVYGVIDNLLPQYLEMQIYRVLLESNAAEQGARMTAMDSATDNANDMIDKLTLQYNRTRQAVITKELSEIVGGAEALK